MSRGELEKKICSVFVEGSFHAKWQYSVGWEILIQENVCFHMKPGPGGKWNVSSKQHTKIFLWEADIFSSR